MGLFSGAKNVVNTLKRMAADAAIPTHTVVLTDDRRHADAPALAELNLLLADPAYTPDVTVDPAHPAITYHAAASRQAEAKAVAAEIAARARQGTPYSRMAVICRNADQYLAPCGTSSGCKISRFSATKLQAPRIPPRPGPSTRRWTCCVACPAEACCAC